MKTLQLSNLGQTIIVDYLVDLIGTNDALTVYEITQQGVSGEGTILLSDAAIATGMPVDVDEYSLATFKAWATTNNYNLKVFEDGETPVTLVTAS